MTAQPPLTPTTPTHSGIGAEVRLRQLGIPGSPVLVDAVRDGASGYRATTTDHPLGYGGHRMWGETVNSIRHGLRSRGWERQVIDGVDLTVSRSTGVGIIVAAGDGSTGDDRFRPHFRYDHPGVISQIVAGGLDTLFDCPAERPTWEVWFLLHHVSAASVRAELSRPTGIGHAGRVTGWLERILLPEQPFVGPGTGSRIASSDQGGGGTPASVDVPVRRRAG